MNMEFEISRTSMWNDKKPCEEAYKKQNNKNYRNF